MFQYHTHPRITNARHAKVHKRLPPPCHPPIHDGTQTHVSPRAHTPCLVLTTTVCSLPYRGSYHRQTYRLRNTTQKSWKDIQKALSLSSLTSPSRARWRRVHSGEWSPQSPLHSWGGTCDMDTKRSYICSMCFCFGRLGSFVFLVLLSGNVS